MHAPQSLLPTADRSLLPSLLLLDMRCRYEFEENRTVCACMEATAELFLGDGFEPEPADGTQQQAADGEAPPPQQQQPNGAVQIEEID